MPIQKITRDKLNGQRTKYVMVTNSDFDNGPVIEVGIVHHNKDKGNASGGLSWGSFLKWYLIIAVIMFSIE